MANAKVCDRCGKIYNIPKKEKPNIFQDLLESLQSNCLINDFENITVCKDDVSIDFCPDCFHKLKNWLKGGDDLDD